MKKQQRFTRSAIALACATFTFCAGNTYASLTDGLVAYWSFDDCTAKDNSGNGHDGTINGNPQCVDGIKGKGLYFDGNGDYILVKNINNFPEAAITMSYWLNRKGNIVANNAEFYFSKELSFQSFLNKNSKLDSAFYLGQSGKWSGYDDAYAGNYSVNYMNNIHYVLSFDNTTKTVKTYINGNLVAKIIESNQNAIVRLSNAPLYIGHNGYSNWDYLKGIMDEARIYNRALTDAEVAALYSQGTATTSAPTCVLTPTPSTITAGQSTTLTATCTPAATSYQWSDTACASTSPTCTVTPSATTNYTVTGSNSGGMGVASPLVGVTVTAAVTPVQKIEAAAAWVAPGETTKLLVTPSTATLSNCSSSDTNIATVNGQSIVGVKRGDATITCNGASTTISVRLPWVTDINPKQAVIGETTIFTVTGQDLNIGYLNFALPNCIGEGVPVWDLTPDTVSLQLILSGLQERKFMCMPVATGTQFAKVHAVSLPSINYADRRLSAPTSPVFFGNNCALSGNCSVNFVSGGSITDKVAISAVIDSILNPYKINGVVPWWRLTSTQIQTIQKQFRDNNISTAFPAAHSAAMKDELAGLTEAYKNAVIDIAGAAAWYGYTWQDAWRPSLWTGFASTQWAAYKGKDWLQLTGGMALNGALAVSDAVSLGSAMAPKAAKFGKYAANAATNLKKIPGVSKILKLNKKFDLMEKLGKMTEVGAATWNAWGSDENATMATILATTKVIGADKLADFLKFGKGEMDEVMTGIAAKVMTEIAIQAPADAAKANDPTIDFKAMGDALSGAMGSSDGIPVTNALIAAVPMVSSWVDMGNLSSKIADRAFGKYFQDNVDKVHEEFRTRDADVLHRYTLQNLIRISSEAENALVNAGVNTALADTNCLFTWAESRYPNLFSPANPPTQTSDYGDVFRLYPSTKTALGVRSNGNVEAYQETTYETKMYPLGPLSDWLPTVKAASCR